MMEAQAVQRTDSAEPNMKTASLSIMINTVENLLQELSGSLALVFLTLLFVEAICILQSDAVIPSVAEPCTGLPVGPQVVRQARKRTYYRSTTCHTGVYIARNSEFNDRSFTYFNRGIKNP